EQFFADHLEMLQTEQTGVPEQTLVLQRVLQYALFQAEASEQKEVNGGSILAAMFHAKESHAVYLLERQGVKRLAVLSYISHGISKVADEPAPAESTPEDGENEAPARDPLKAFTVNLVERAAAGEIDPLIGRTAELQRTIQILCRRRKNNPIY